MASQGTPKAVPGQWPLFFDPAFDAVVEPLPLAADVKREARWDAADLDAISGPYGDYPLGKVGKVFPGLKAAVLQVRGSRRDPEGSLLTMTNTFGTQPCTSS